jgi:WD repeat-containing protein 48
MVASAVHDVRILEEVLPMWLLEYLLLNKAPPAPVPKLSFVLLPWPSKDPDVEQLPELLDM